MKIIDILLEYQQRDNYIRSCVYFTFLWQQFITKQLICNTLRQLWSGKSMKLNFINNSIITKEFQIFTNI